CDRDAMQRAANLAAEYLELGRARLFDCEFRRDEGVAAELAVQLLDSIQHRLGHFDRRYLLAVDSPCRLPQFEIVQVCVGHHPSPWATIVSFARRGLEA